MNSREAKLSTYVAIVPADATLLKNFQWLYVTGAGNLVLKGTEGGAVPVTIAVAANSYHPFGEGFVMAATTATGVVGLG